ncbi:glycosyltransferase family 4 protein, partial [Escherichia coli]
ISNISSQSNKLITSLLLFLYSIFCLVDLKLNKCNVVYLNNYKSLYVGYILSFFFKKNYICHIRDEFTGRVWEKIILKRLDKINAVFLVNSKFTYNSICDVYKPQKIEVVYNGIAVDDNAGVMYLEKHTKKSVFHLGIFSRISKNKGQLEFLNAISSVKNISIIIHLFGDVVHGEEEYFEKIKIKKSELECNEVQVLIHGYTSEPIDMMKGMDIVVLPTIKPEPFGRVIIEAQMLGKIVVANNKGGPCEIICNGVNGFLANDVSQYASIIENIISNWDSMDLISTNAKKSVAENFTVEKMTTKVNEVLSSYENSAL